MQLSPELDLNRQKPRYFFLREKGQRQPQCECRIAARWWGMEQGEMEDQERARADAAAGWLLDEFGVRGVFARLNGLLPGTTRLGRGIWYPIRSHDARRGTLHLDRDGKEVEVNAEQLTFCKDLPRTTVVFTEGRWGDRSQMIKWVGVCPKGHRHELGESSPLVLGTIACPECKVDYEWELEKLPSRE